MHGSFLRCSEYLINTSICSPCTTEHLGGESRSLDLTVVPCTAFSFDPVRCLRDDFALGLEASSNVRNIIAAKAFRLWLRRRRSSEILDELPVSITDTAATLQPTIAMTAGQLRGVDAERSNVLRELLAALGATGTDQQSESQGHSAEAGDNEPPPSGSSGKQSKKGTKRKKAEESTRDDATMQTTRECSSKSTEKHRVDGSSISSSGGEKGGEQRRSTKRAKTNSSRKAQETRRVDQSAQEGGTMSRAKKKRERVVKSSRSANSSVEKIGTDVAVFFSAARPEKRKIKHQGAASCPDKPTSLLTTNTSEKLKTKSSEDSGTGSSSSGGVRQNPGDNPAGGTSPKRASKKRKKATQNVMLWAQPVQPDGSTEAGKMKKKKRGSESSRSREGSMQDSAAGTKDTSVIDLTSDSSPRQAEKKIREREEDLTCSHDRARPDDLTESGIAKKKRKAVKESRKSSSSDSGAQRGSARAERQQATSAEDSSKKRTKKKRKVRERQEM